MKRGFTMIELLSVIVIVGLIGTIAIPTITSSIKSYRQKLLDTQIANIEEAARSWGAKHLDYLPTSNNTSLVKTIDEIKTETGEYGVLIITLKVLQDENFIEKEIKDPTTKKAISPTTEIYITNLTNRYSYEVKKS